MKKQVFRATLTCTLPFLAFACGSESIKDVVAHLQDQQRETAARQRDNYKVLAGNYILASNDTSGHRVVLYMEEPLPINRVDAGQLVPGYTLSGKVCMDEDDIHPGKLYSYHFTNGLYDPATRTFVANIGLSGASEIIAFSCVYSNLDSPVCKWRPNSGAANTAEFHLKRTSTDVQSQCADSAI